VAYWIKVTGTGEHPFTDERLAAAARPLGT